VWALPQKFGVALSLLAPFYVGELKQTVQSLTQKNSMYNLTLTSRATALLSFGFGTILFSLFLYFGESIVPIMVGVKFVIVAILVNSILFLTNIILAITNSKNRMELLKTCGILLLNIPIAILYFYIVISIEFSSKF
jgi:hypothetical protein